MSLKSISRISCAFKLAFKKENGSKMTLREESFLEGDSRKPLPPLGFVTHPLKLCENQCTLSKKIHMRELLVPFARLLMAYHGRSEGYPVGRQRGHRRGRLAA